MQSMVITKKRLKNKEFVKNFIRTYLPSAGACIFLLIVGQILSNGFASITNIIYILTVSSLLAIASFGQSVVILAGNGGIDLTIGSVMSMGALIGPMIMNGTFSKLPYAILSLILMGAIIGLINGIGVQFFKIPAMAMTLIMLTVINGFTLMYTKGQPSIVVPDQLKNVGKPIWFSISPMIVIAIIFLILLELLLRRTRFGRSIYLIGSNRQAAYLCGINVSIIAVSVYVMAAIIAGFAGFCWLDTAEAVNLVWAAPIQCRQSQLL